MNEALASRDAAETTLASAQARGLAAPPRAAGGSRTTTVDARRRAVEAVIASMRRRLDEPLSLRDLAEVAILSAFHFSRVFRETTGLPPAQFLYALRLDAAKRLLLTTRRSVINVCYDVGYNSLGTFTTRFTALVGVSPRRLRHLRDELRREIGAWGARWARHGPAAGPGPGVRGCIERIESAGRPAGPIFVGLFPRAVPQGRPTACTVMTTTGVYRIAPVPPGRYHVFAVQLRAADDPLAVLLPADALRGGGGVVMVADDAADARADVVLRAPRPTDPPILVSLPSLLRDATSKKTRARARVRVIAGDAHGSATAQSPEGGHSNGYRPLQQVGADAGRRGSGLDGGRAS